MRSLNSKPLSREVKRPARPEISLLEDLEFERSDIEMRINDKFNELATAGRDSYIKETVGMIQFTINRANEEIAKG